MSGNRRGGRAPRRGWLAALACAAVLGVAPSARAQLPIEHVGEAVPRDVREIYDKGLKWLVAHQSDDGSWPSAQAGPGVTGLCLMCFLASGEDPNFGLYTNPIRKALRNIISGQDPSTGYFGNSMYHHGFAMLALAEAYGAVDERTLWPEGSTERKRSIGQALELAVRAAVTSQKKNSFGGWRYSPDSNDADTSVSGAVLVGLLAARNAGIEVPDESIDRAISYYKSMTSDSGHVAYSGGMGGFDESLARSSIGSLVFAIARRKDIPQYNATVEYLKERLEQVSPGHYLEYTRYYQAQALFQGDVEAWGRWNELLTRAIKESQQPDGSIPGQFGPELGTSMSLLALALNFRFLPIYER
jgi:hypothetical protein